MAAVPLTEGKRPKLDQYYFRPIISAELLLKRSAIDKNQSSATDSPKQLPLVVGCSPGHKLRPPFQQETVSRVTQHGGENTTFLEDLHGQAQLSGLRNQEVSFLGVKLP